VSDDADERLVRAEMQEIAKALRQFRQDTGYFPQQGPFALDIDSGQVVNAGLPLHARGLANAAKRRWFYSPANFSQLLSSTSPLNGSGHQLTEWDAETGRGWRGPYLSGFRDGFVDIGDEINPDQQGENGDPTTVVVAAILDVDGLADPFLHRSVAVVDAAVDNDLLDWASLVRPNRTELNQWGRPYLFLEVNGRWSLVSMGPNGEYDQGGDDDIVLPLE
jgi:hypothetical protein